MNYLYSPSPNGLVTENIAKINLHEKRMELNL